MDIIKIENLKYAYSKTDQAITGLDLTVEKGKWLSIIGHNGSGKSTLAKILIGLLKPKNGTVVIDGLELNKDNVNEIRKKIGIVFQNPDNQFVGVTVEHDIAFGLENRNVAYEMMHTLVLENAKKVGMEDFLKKEPGHLSGGQKQRVAIAGLLASNPEIIIFDEATSMLDPEGNESIIALIKELKAKSGKTLITITHDLDLAKLSDVIVVMKAGKIIKKGTPEEIFSDPVILESAKVDMPFILKTLSKVQEDPELNKSKELVEILWELSLKK